MQYKVQITGHSIHCVRVHEIIKANNWTNMINKLIKIKDHNNYKLNSTISLIKGRNNPNKYKEKNTLADLLVRCKSSDQVS